MTGSLSFAVAVAKAEAYDRLCAEIDRLQQGIKAALAMSPACTIDYNVRIRLERLLRPADQE